MIKDRYISLEKYGELETAKQRLQLKTSHSNLQQHYIRQHVAKVIGNDFQWGYWVVITLGHNPDVIEAEDCLSKLAYRLDRRLIKHTQEKVCLNKEDRTEWICLPEKQNLGVHYNCFLKFNVSPCIGTSYESEREWLEVALRNNLDVLIPHFPSLGKGKPSVFVRERSRDRVEGIRQVLYSSKEFQVGTRHNDIDPTFDRFERILISAIHWKNIPIHKHRSPNKVETIPPLFDKPEANELSKYTV